jgi:hypothetical protein
LDTWNRLSNHRAPTRRKLRLVLAQPAIQHARNRGADREPLPDAITGNVQAAAIPPSTCTMT